MPTAKNLRRPFEGIRVADLSLVLAGPHATSYLADWGAEVIRVEPLQVLQASTRGRFARPSQAYIDSMRNWLNAYPDFTMTGRDFNCWPFFQSHGKNKMSMTLDLQQDEGIAVLKQLLALSDIVIENNAPATVDKLGIGYDSLSDINPDLVYVSANGYGPSGPGAKRPSTHPIPGAALGGVVWQMGGLPSTDEELDNDGLRETSRKLLRANEVNPDPNTSMVVATAALVGLASRRAHGRGQKVYVDMFGANAWANWDDFLSYEGKPERQPVDPDGYGLGPLQRLYPCRDGWVFLMVVSDREWAAFTAETGFEGSRDDDDLADRLAALFGGDDADAWERRLAPRGVGCVRADGLPPQEFFLRDPHCRAEELAVPAVHPDWGDYLRNGPMARFVRGDDYIGTGAAGGATVKLLGELGYSAAQTEELIEARRVYARRESA